MKRRGKRKAEAEIKKSPGKPTLHDLSTVLLCEVIKFLSFKDRVPLWQTCKAVYGYIQHPAVWPSRLTLGPMTTDSFKRLAPLLEHKSFKSLTLPVWFNLLCVAVSDVVYGGG
jgi:hypothetical protein